uniref:AEBP2-like C-terminal SH3 domain-containing protein n=1 Tax=Oncorhynchus tshawytscha TaxID=74940 RepID=A0AAZ3QR43_ONCTS
MEVRVAECGQDGEEGDVKPAAETDEETAVAVTEATTVSAATGVADDDGDEEKTMGCKLSKTDEDCSDPEKQSCLVDGGENSETVKDTAKESKPEEQREESKSPVTVSDCVGKSKVRDDAPEPGQEKTSTRGGDREELAVGDKRRASVEMSSSDGEPLSRMNSEDSISSTLMDMESTVSSGRSTPAMMNEQGSATPVPGSGEHLPDLPEHIRALHVERQRGGVGSIRNQDEIGLLSPLPPARPHDFFDTQTMDAIRHRAICLNLPTHTRRAPPVFFFLSRVMARRREGSGKVKVLLHWTPEDILPDVWVNETERSQLNTKVVHLSQLPQDLLLDPNIYRSLFFSLSVPACTDLAFWMIAG